MGGLVQAARSTTLQHQEGFHTIKEAGGTAQEHSALFPNLCATRGGSLHQCPHIPHTEDLPVSPQYAQASRPMNMMITDTHPNGGCASPQHGTRKQSPVLNNS